MSIEDLRTELDEEDNIVHGDIRHLEKGFNRLNQGDCVHGDIRHLEIESQVEDRQTGVHGDIRHLEKAPN